MHTLRAMLVRYLSHYKRQHLPIAFGVLHHLDGNPFGPSGLAENLNQLAQAVVDTNGNGRIGPAFGVHQDDAGRNRGNAFLVLDFHALDVEVLQIGRASCRERV